MIAPIHKDIITKYNSVNVIVGKQSLGKTVTALEEIIKIQLRTVVSVDDPAGLEAVKNDCGLNDSRLQTRGFSE